MSPDPSAAAPTPAPQDAVPIPPRYWWWNRIALALIVLVLNLVVSYFALWLVADRRLSQRLEEIRARGEPVETRDFVFAEIPPGKNAAPFLRATHENLMAAATARQADDWLKNPALIGAAANDGGSALAALRGARDEFRSAIARGHCDWGVRISSPMIRMLYPELGRQRQICKFMNALARFDVAQGNIGDALDTAEDLLRHSAFVGEGGPLICMLVGVATERLTLETLTQALPKTDLTDPSQCEQLRSILQLLNDERAAHQQVQAAVNTERVLYIDVLLTAPEQLDEFGGQGRLLKLLHGPLTPLRKLDLTRMMDVCDRLSEFARAPDETTATAMTPLSPNLVGLERAVRPYSYVILPTLDRGFMMHHERLTARRRCARDIARLLFESEMGRKPAADHELVPLYLPQFHRDPYPVSQPCSQPIVSEN